MGIFTLLARFNWVTVGILSLGLAFSPSAGVFAKTKKKKPTTPVKPTVDETLDTYGENSPGKDFSQEDGARDFLQDDPFQAQQGQKLEDPVAIETDWAEGNQAASLDLDRELERASLVSPEDNQASLKRAPKVQVATKPDKTSIERHRELHPEHLRKNLIKPPSQLDGSGQALSVKAAPSAKGKTALPPPVPGSVQPVTTRQDPGDDVKTKSSTKLWAKNSPFRDPMHDRGSGHDVTASRPEVPSSRPVLALAFIVGMIVGLVGTFGRTYAKAKSYRRSQLKREV